MASWGFGGCAMAYIEYLPADAVPESSRVPDNDNILRIHGVDPPMMRLHYDLYRHVMYGPGPLTRIQRETVAVAVSVRNGCVY